MQTEEAFKFHPVQALQQPEKEKAHGSLVFLTLHQCHQHSTDFEGITVALLQHQQDEK